MSNTIIVSERRRSWPDDLKLRMLSEADAAGESICSVARRYEIDPAQMYQWRKKFRDKEASTPVMLPIEITEAPSSFESKPIATKMPELATDGGRIEIALKNGVHLFAPLEVDIKQLGRLVGVLEKA